MVWTYNYVIHEPKPPLFSILSWYNYKNIIMIYDVEYIQSHSIYLFNLFHLV